MLSGKFYKYYRLFCLSLGMFLVALLASTSSIGTLIGTYELVQGNMTEQWKLLMLLAFPIFAFLSFMVLFSMIKRAKNILNSDDAQIVDLKEKPTD